MQYSRALLRTLQETYPYINERAEKAQLDISKAKYFFKSINTLSTVDCKYGYRLLEYLKLKETHKDHPLQISAPCRTT